MRYLLDTNALLYIFSAPSELSARARRIARSESDLSVSVVSFWEIAIKQSIGKLQFGMTIPKLESVCIERNIQILGTCPSLRDHIATLHIEVSRTTCSRSRRRVQHRRQPPAVRGEPDPVHHPRPGAPRPHAVREQPQYLRHERRAPQYLPARNLRYPPHQRPILKGTS